MTNMMGAQVDSSRAETSGIAGRPPHAMSAIGAVRRIFAMLVAQYLLGMAENLIGLPSETSGAANAVSMVVLTTHVALAIGLVLGAARVALVLRRAGRPVRRLATLALAVVVVTFVSGGMTTMDAAHTEAWSYLMAAGFIVAAALYVALYVRILEPAS